MESHSPVTHGATNRTVDLGELRLTETSHAPRFRLGKHRHAYPAATFVLTGGFIEDFGRGRVLDCVAMSLLVKPADAVHSNVYSTVGARSFIVECTSESSLFRNLQRSAPHLGRTRFTPMLFRTYEAFRANAPEQRVLAEELALELACDDTGTLDWRVSHRPPWLDGIAAEIHHGCTQPLGLTTLASHVGVHPIYLARVFRRHHGQSIGEYMTQSRIRLVMRRLATSADAISRIAIDAGFADQPHLTRVFRREVGTTPARFRRLTSTLPK